MTPLQAAPPAVIVRALLSHATFLFCPSMPHLEDRNADHLVFCKCMPLQWASAGDPGSVAFT